MRRILLVETAAPKRVRRKADEILSEAGDPAQELTILCRDHPETVQYLSGIQSARIVPLQESGRREILAGLRRQKFDRLHVFWTAEKGYLGAKFLALQLGARITEVDIGDGHVLRLTWRSFLRFLWIRCRHPRPSDHPLFAATPMALERGSGPKPAFTDRAEIVADPWQGERILILQSAEPPVVLRALDRLNEKQLFRNPQYTLFCRHRPEALQCFTGHPLLHRVQSHREARGTWKHLRDLRRERFDAVVVLFTGDPSYWKIKYFAFLLGARHKLIFNENNDCFFFSWGPWLALLAQRWGERAHADVPPRWSHQARIPARMMLKLALLPFRFVWLLLVWLRLRCHGLRVAGRYHDRPL